MTIMSKPLDILRAKSGVPDIELVILGLLTGTFTAMAAMTHASLGDLAYDVDLLPWKTLADVFGWGTGD